MTDQEYENQKRECWEEYKRENLDGEVQCQRRYAKVPLTKPHKSTSPCSQL